MFNIAYVVIFGIVLIGSIIVHFASENVGGSGSKKKNSAAKGYTIDELVEYDMMDDED